MLPKMAPLARDQAMSALSVPVSRTARGGSNTWTPLLLGRCWAAPGPSMPATAYTRSVQSWARNVRALLNMQGQWPLDRAQLPSA